VQPACAELYPENKPAAVVGRDYERRVTDQWRGMTKVTVKLLRVVMVVVSSGKNLETEVLVESWCDGQEALWIVQNVSYAVVRVILEQRIDSGQREVVGQARVFDTQT